MGCQVCNKEVPNDEELKGLQNNLRFSPSEHYQICSNECQEIAIGFNACWKLKDKLRNKVSFDDFNKAMEFPTEGGYADDQYERYRHNPMLFMFRLDQANFLKFVKMKAR